MSSCGSTVTEWVVSEGYEFFWILSEGTAKFILGLFNWGLKYFLLSLSSKTVPLTFSFLQNLIHFPWKYKSPIIQNNIVFFGIAVHWHFQLQTSWLYQGKAGNIYCTMEKYHQKLTLEICIYYSKHQISASGGWLCKQVHGWLMFFSWTCLAWIIKSFLFCMLKSSSFTLSTSCSYLVTLTLSWPSSSPSVHESL